MGKKEKDIAKQNSDYYKEINETYDCFQENEEDIIQYEIDLQSDIDHTNFDDVVYEIKTGLLEYVSQESLPLCQNLDLINLENFVNFVLCGCPISKMYRNEQPIVEFVKSNIDCEPSVTIEESRLIEEDIKRIKEQIIQSLGEDLLLNSYNNELKQNVKKGTIFNDVCLLDFRKMSIKQAGAKLYWNTVDFYGFKEYERMYK